MKHPITSAVLLLTVLAGVASAQEIVPLDKAQSMAVKVNASLGRLEDAPFTVEPDTSKPQAIHASKIGIMILPDKGLTAESLAAVDKTPKPVGQLWMLNAAVAEGSSAAPKSKLRNVVVEEGDKERDVQLYLLGVAKNDQGATELLVFGKGKEPLARAPLASGGSSSQTLPLELSGRKESEDSGVLTINVLGQYKADVRLARPQE